MELAGKKVTYDEELSDTQLQELHTNYQHLWQALKVVEFDDGQRELQVLYQEADNTANYEAAFFTLQVRHRDDRFHFDEYTIIVNNKSTFNDSDDEEVIELSQYDDWAKLEAQAVTSAKKWAAKFN